MRAQLAEVALGRVAAGREDERHPRARQPARVEVAQRGDDGEGAVAAARPAPVDSAAVQIEPRLGSHRRLAVPISTGTIRERNV
jgi:hypothetical protein